jgi:hypothetical protein
MNLLEKRVPIIHIHASHFTVATHQVIQHLDEESEKVGLVFGVPHSVSTRPSKFDCGRHLRVRAWVR